MTTEQKFTIITILLTAINAFMTYINFRHNRKKEFQEKLFELKLEAFNEINQVCLNAIRRLDINSSPFNEIYEYKNLEAWEEYCEKNIGEQFIKSLDMKDLTYKYGIIIPPCILDKYHEFANLCVAYVTTSTHFETKLIVNLQEKLHNHYIDILNEFRTDLKIETIDDSLKNRLLSKM
jgi:hypothetical protein